MKIFVIFADFRVGTKRDCGASALLTMCSFAMAEAGTYTGVGDSEIGGKGAIEVSVTVDENGVVTDIQVTKNGDTAGIASLEGSTWP